MPNYKLWTFGEKLYSPDVNSYLMSQTVPRFANTTERGTQLTAPATGQLCFVTSLGYYQYSGTAWVPVEGTEVCHLYRATAQSIPDSTYTAISFSAADSLRYGGWASSPNPTRFVGPFSGRYEFKYSTGWASSPVVQAIRLEKNGSVVNGSKSQSSATGLAAINGNCRVSLNGTTDYVEVHVLHTNGSSINTYTADGRPELRATYLGPS